MGIRLVCCLNLVFDGYYELLWIAWCGVVAWNVKATSWTIVDNWIHKILVDPMSIC